LTEAQANGNIFNYEKVNLYTVSLLIIVVGLLSCKKEDSCADCIGNKHPLLAVGGPDTVIILPTDSVLLNGSNSSDPDGKISEWHLQNQKHPPWANMMSHVF